MKIKEIIERSFREKYKEKIIQISTKSMLTGYDESMGLCKWSNCLYISFLKKDFPLINYPEWVLKDPTVSYDRDHFNYFNGDLARLHWHWGITFYEEQTVEGKIIVKAGCDYMHLNDEHVYGIEDCGKHILLSHGVEILDQFKNMYQLLETLEEKNEKVSL